MSEPLAVEVKAVSKRFRIVHHAGSLKRAAIELVRRRPAVELMTAVDNLSFSVPRGQTVGIIGSNGSGKSTMLMLLAGIYRPSQGEIVVRGRITTLLDLYAGMHPDLTAADNAILVAMTNGLTRRQAIDRLPTILEFAELLDVADQRIRHFSAGMVVRLGFSVAAYCDPEVLLVDEVLAVGDQSFQAKCRGKVAEFQREGRTIVFVSHDLPAVAASCERVIWLDRSRLRMDGPAAEVLAAYAQSV
ncbi:MAG: ABC transporter ATP-binding protein [Armatimonadetes bacterium]|nr:ABC transporter ATP-binding protein [Armatimonadota bacterium]